MSAAVIYDGVGNGGTLFQDKKFWLAQRVPQRPRWVAAIQSNGGQVTLLEKNAEILIADHAHKGAPPGSYSWTFIQESLRFGKLQALSDHPAGPSIGVARQVGSVQPTKLTRTPFTVADDRFLLGWVLHAERKGISLSGNQLYQDLERANTRHTWQSWRDRYVKSLRHKPRPLDGDLVEIIDEVVPAFAGQRSSGLQKQDELRPSDNRTHSRVARRVDASTIKDQTAKLLSRGKCSVTMDDVALLEAEHDAIQGMDADKSVAAWQCWAEMQNPQHTAAEWQWIWTRKVRKLLERERNKELEEPAKRQLSPLPRKKDDTVMKPVSSPDIADKVSEQPKDHSTTNTAMSLTGTFDDNETQPDHHNTTNKTVSPSRSVDDDNIQPGNHAAHSHGSSGADPMLGRIDSSLLLPMPSLSLVQISESEFLEIYKWFTEAREIETKFTHVVCGRSLDLFRLRQLVNSAEFGGFDAFTSIAHWARLATELNFNVFKYPQAAKELETLYTETLLDFDDSLKTEGNDEVTASTPSDATRSAVVGTALVDALELINEAIQEEGDAGDIRTIPLVSAPFPPSLKRSASEMTGRLVTRMQSTSPNKRAACDESALEIPSTPEPAERPLRKTSAEPSMDCHSPPINRTPQLSRSTTPSEMPNYRKAKKTRARDPNFTGSVTQATDRAEQLASTKSIETDEAVSDSGMLDEKTLETSKARGPQNKGLLQEWIDTHIAYSYPEEIVIQALQATTMETGDASLVMESLINDKRIPDNIQGVWTAEDDDLIRKGVTHPAYGMITRKHGHQRCQKRKEFLRIADAILEVNLM